MLIQNYMGLITYLVLKIYIFMKITAVYFIVRFCYTACPLQCTIIVLQILFWKITTNYFYVSTVKHNENGNKQGEINSSVLKLWIKYMRMLATKWLQIIKIRNTLQSNIVLKSSGVTLQWPCVLTLEAQQLAHKLQTTEQCHFSSDTSDGY
jgi:hypothetical protein